MRLKILLPALILIISTSSAFSQRFQGGLLGGLSTSQIDGDTQKSFKKAGVFGGVYVETSFSEVLGAKIELLYIGKGAKQIIDEIEQFKTSLHYIEMPFLLTIKPVDKFELDIGVTVSYLISSKLEKLNETIPENLYEMHNFDVGGIASATYFFAKNAGFNVRVEYSIMPIKNNPNWFNYNLNLGIIYKIL